MKYLKDILKKKKPRDTERPKVVKTFEATTAPKRKKVFRITYRLKAGEPLVGEIIIKTTKDRWEINFAEEIAKYWEKNKKDLKLDEILLINQIR